MKIINMSDHFRTGSALLEFLAGRLGAPECWPNECRVKSTIIRASRTKHITPSETAASRSPMEDTRSHLTSTKPNRYE